MAQLFDASEFIDSNAINASLNEVRNYQLQPPQTNQPANPAPQLENLFQPDPQQNNDDGGLIGMIMNMF